MLGSHLQAHTSRGRGASAIYRLEAKVGIGYIFGALLRGAGELLNS